jgi:hypothetical protein
MLIRCFAGATLVGLCVGALAAIEVGPPEDPFAAMGRLGAYVTVLAAIVGGVLLALAFAASIDPQRSRDRDISPR